MPVKAAEEIPDRSGPNVVAICVAFGLNVNPVEPEGVLVDHAIDAVVAAAANRAACIDGGPAKAHAKQQIHNKTLEKVRRCSANAVEKLLGKRCIDLPVGYTHYLVRRRFEPTSP